MNPSRGESQPQLEQIPAQPGFEQSSDVAPEVPAAPEASPGKQPPQATVIPADTALQPLPLPPAVSATSAQNDPATTATAATDLPAADADRIEKQWVQRAKVIVAETQDDPHKQKSEMSKVQAEYIKKRYNKMVQVDDPGAA